MPQVSSYYPEHGHHQQSLTEPLPVHRSRSLGDGVNSQHHHHNPAVNGADQHNGFIGNSYQHNGYYGDLHRNVALGGHESKASSWSNGAGGYGVQNVGMRKALFNPDDNKIITVYRNGDEFDPGTEVVVSRQQFKHWLTLLEFITKRLRLVEAVNKIFTLDGSQEIRHFRDLKNGGKYVAARHRFMRVNYGQRPQPPWNKDDAIKYQPVTGIDSAESRLMYLNSNDFKPTLEDIWDDPEFDRRNKGGHNNKPHAQAYQRPNNFPHDHRSVPHQAQPPFHVPPNVPKRDFDPFRPEHQVSGEHAARLNVPNGQHHNNYGSSEHLHHEAIYNEVAPPLVQRSSSYNGQLHNDLPMERPRQLYSPKTDGARKALESAKSKHLHAMSSDKLHIHIHNHTEQPSTTDARQTLQQTTKTVSPHGSRNLRPGSMKQSPVHPDPYWQPRMSPRDEVINSTFHRPPNVENGHVQNYPLHQRAMPYRQDNGFHPEPPQNQPRSKFLTNGGALPGAARDHSQITGDNMSYYQPAPLDLPPSLDQKQQRKFVNGRPAADKAVAATADELYQLQLQQQERHLQQYHQQGQTLPAFRQTERNHLESHMDRPPAWSEEF